MQIFRHLKFVVLAIVLSSLLGCVTSTDNPIPATLRKPYFGTEVQHDGKRYKWVNEGYYQLGDERIFVAPFYEVYKNTPTRGDNLKGVFLVAAEKNDQYHIAILAIGKEDVKNVASQATESALFVIQPDPLISYVVRYICLTENKAMGCTMDRFDPTKSQYIGLTIEAQAIQSFTAQGKGPLNFKTAPITTSAKGLTIFFKRIGLENSTEFSMLHSKKIQILKK